MGFCTKKQIVPGLQHLVQAPLRVQFKLESTLPIIHAAPPSLLGWLNITLLTITLLWNPPAAAGTRCQQRSSNPWPAWTTFALVL